MNRHACEYAIVRFLPYVETGEFANIGVVLACPETGYFDLKLMSTRRTGRIAGFFDRLDKRVFRNAVRGLAEEFERLRNLLATERMGFPRTVVRQLFAAFAHPADGLIRFSNVRVVSAEDPAEKLVSLYARVVEREFANKEYHDVLLERSVRQVLHKAKLRHVFQPDDIGGADYRVRLPFVHWWNGMADAAIKPLDLAKDEPHKVFEIGGSWVERMRRLKKHRDLPERVLFALKFPASADDGIQDAAGEIADELREQGITVVDVGDERQILDFARQVMH